MSAAFSQKVAIVTGAAQGVGEAIARQLAAAGAKVAVSDLNPDRLERVAEAIWAAGGKALVITADVSNKFQAVHVVETTRAAWGRLDILVNALEVASSAPLLKVDEWNWNRDLEVNLKSVFLMMQLCGRVMAWENAGRGGVIVNLGGVTGALRPERATYYAGKAGVAALTQAAAVELAPFGVRVNAVLPGPLDTPAEAAEAVMSLCSDAAADMTGKLLPATGGKEPGH